MKATGFILLFILSSCSSDKITDLKGKKFVLVESDTMYMFDHTAYLYHIANLSNILAPYKNYLGISICKQELKDNCTIPLLSNQQAQCNIIQENNIPIQILDHGNIVITNEHTWNGLKINGPHLIQFKTSTSIDNKTYVNHQEEIKNVIHAHNNEQVDVLKILASNSN